VSAEVGEDWLEFAVTDNGIGIPPDQVERMFEAFTQGHTGLSRRYEGTGLGLPLSRSLAELHEGRLEIGPAANSGTRAVLLLPKSRFRGLQSSPR